MDFLSQMQERTREINERIDEFLPKEEGYQKIIYEAMNYSVHVGGKRIRPMLMLETYKLFGGTSSVVFPFMAAIEMIHTYSLVHDDLPAMDNDMYRRGELTTHAKFGEDLGILAGDALLNYAYETAFSAFSIQDDKADVVKALRVLANKAGVYGMVGGQVVDVMSEKGSSDLSKDKLDFIYRLKTGALIEASMMIGALLAGADEETVLKVEKIASKIGLSFQIQDDILDITGSFDELGKPIGSDERNEKPTYATFEGIEKSIEDVKRLSYEAISLLKELGGDYAFLQELFVYLIERRK